MASPNLQRFVRRISQEYPNGPQLSSSPSLKESLTPAIHALRISAGTSCGARFMAKRRNSLIPLTSLKCGDILMWLKHMHVSVFVSAFAAAMPPVDGKLLMEYCADDGKLLKKEFPKIGTRLQRKKLLRIVDEAARSGVNALSVGRSSNQTSPNIPIPSPNMRSEFNNDNANIISSSYGMSSLSPPSTSPPISPTQQIPVSLSSSQQPGVSYLQQQQQWMQPLQNQSYGTPTIQTNFQQNDQRGQYIPSVEQQHVLSSGGRLPPWSPTGREIYAATLASAESIDKPIENSAAPRNISPTRPPSPPPVPVPSSSASFLPTSPRVQHAAEVSSQRVRSESATSRRVSGEEAAYTELPIARLPSLGTDSDSRGESPSTINASEVMKNGKTISLPGEALRRFSTPSPSRLRRQGSSGSVSNAAAAGAARRGTPRSSRLSTLSPRTDQEIRSSNKKKIHKRSNSFEDIERRTFDNSVRRIRSRSRSFDMADERDQNNNSFGSRESNLSKQQLEDAQNLLVAAIATPEAPSPLRRKSFTRRLSGRKNGERLKKGRAGSVQSVSSSSAGKRMRRLSKKGGGEMGHIENDRDYTVGTLLGTGSGSFGADAGASTTVFGTNASSSSPARVTAPAEPTAESLILELQRQLAKERERSEAQAKLILKQSQKISSLSSSVSPKARKVNSAPNLLSFNE